jgi:hypothetical protein
MRPSTLKLSSRWGKSAIIVGKVGSISSWSTVPVAFKEAASATRSLDSAPFQKKAKGGRPLKVEKWKRIPNETSGHGRDKPAPGHRPSCWPDKRKRMKVKVTVSVERSKYPNLTIEELRYFIADSLRFEEASSVEENEGRDNFFGRNISAYLELEITVHDPRRRSNLPLKQSKIYDGKPT